MAALGRGAGAGEFASLVNKLLIADGCEHDRRGQLLAEQIDARIDPTDVHETPRTNLPGFEGSTVRAHRLAVVGTADDEMPRREAEPAFRRRLDLEHVERLPR